MSDSDQAKIWRSLARRTCLKFNVGWWLDRLTPMLIGAGLVAAVTLMVLRSMEFALDPGSLALIAVAVVAIICALAWAIARHRFIGEREALVQLESHLHLKNALTTADHGVAPWPSPPQDGQRADVTTGLRWRWSMVLMPFVSAAIMVAAGLLVPVSSIAKKQELPPSEPLAREQVDKWLDKLEETEVIAQQAIEEYRDSLEELRQQDPGDWFSHASMEAGDSLRDALGRETQQMEADLSKIERNLNALQNYSQQIDEKTRSQLIEEYQNAVQGLELGKLPLNKEMLEALQSIDPAKLGDALSQLSEEQMQQLREQLKKGAQACKECQGGGSGLGEMSDSEMLLGILRSEQEKKNGQGKGELPGSGGISRGRGDAPMAFGDEKELNSGQLEAVTNLDLSRAAPGDVIGSGETEHEIDETKSGPVEAGAVINNGQGGDAVWRESLLPEEKAVLKKYFK